MTAARDMDKADLEALRANVGNRLFRRGKEYWESGAVSFRDVSGEAVRAVVRGSRPYVVDLVRGGDGLRGVCTCPYSEGEIVCKHVVAVAFAWAQDPSPRADTMLLAGHLDAMPREALVDLVWKTAANDPGLFRSMLLEATSTARNRDEVMLGLSRLADDALDAAYDGNEDAPGLLDRLIGRLRAETNGGMASDVMACTWRMASRIDGEGEFPGSDDHAIDDEEDDGIAEAFLVRILSVHAEACGGMGLHAEIVAREVYPLCSRSPAGRWGPRFEAYVAVFGKAFAAEWADLAKAVPDGGR